MFFNINCAEGNESSSFVSESRIISRFLLMINCKASDLFLKELIFKCHTILLLGEFSFINFSPIVAPINSSEAENEEFRMASA